jgi:hypothetical protein
MNVWLRKVFEAGAVAKGNIVRRKKASIERQSSMAELESEVRRRRFHLVETGDQVIVICNQGHVRILI